MQEWSIWDLNFGFYTQNTYVINFPGLESHIQVNICGNWFVKASNRALWLNSYRNINIYTDVFRKCIDVVFSKLQSRCRNWVLLLSISDYTQKCPYSQLPSSKIVHVGQNIRKIMLSCYTVHIYIYTVLLRLFWGGASPPPTFPVRAVPGKKGS